jgi:hypothetical protein
LLVDERILSQIQSGSVQKITDRDPGGQKFSDPDTDADPEHCSSSSQCWMGCV